MSYSIAIDGPAGAGKSTIAKIVSKQLGYTYIDTGAMYRAMAVYFDEKGVNPDDENEINEHVDEVDIELKHIDGLQHVFLNSADVTDKLRLEQTGKMASKTSKYGAVRSKLVELQRKIAKSCDVIMDGRDIGTVVLPDAFLKIYLTASVDTRAKRRFDELKEKGQDCNLDLIKKDIADRDYADMHREISPLKQADDAVLLDTSDMDIDAVVGAIIKLIEEKKN